ncbi:hypothetical protein ACFY2R_16955 [Micromonospora olivasterospora]|uniref:RHIM domain-containing protein n=1 Tax=Micromonospora olivasterospora TaxID=1880 RepID=A0A562IFW5_MICOL|nr:hypothetical protein [Micromonospora olivasterospora]TWH69911.1 hypothetical protein JD77_04928 [Micromonospora olivasterospora]
MSGVELLVAALMGGLTAGVGDATSGLVRDGFVRLRDLVRPRLTARGEEALRALEAEESDQGVWQVRLTEELIRSGADRDARILAAARELLAQVEAAGGRTEVGHVDLREARGVQLGSHNTQHNTFN